MTSASPAALSPSPELTPSTFPQLVVLGTDALFTRKIPPPLALIPGPGGPQRSRPQRWRALLRTARSFPPTQPPPRQYGACTGPLPCTGTPRCANRSAAARHAHCRGWRAGTSPCHVPDRAVRTGRKEPSGAGLAGSKSSRGKPTRWHAVFLSQLRGRPPARMRACMMNWRWPASHGSLACIPCPDVGSPPGHSRPSQCQTPLRYHADAPPLPSRWGAAAHAVYT
jgi:hypothetical protein